MSWFFVASVLSLVSRSYTQANLDRHNCSTVSCSTRMLGATIFWLYIISVLDLFIFSPILRLSLFSSVIIVCGSWGVLAVKTISSANLRLVI